MIERAKERGWFRDWGGTALRHGTRGTVGFGDGDRGGSVAGSSRCAGRWAASAGCFDPVRSGVSRFGLPVVRGVGYDGASPDLMLGMNASWRSKGRWLVRCLVFRNRALGKFHAVQDRLEHDSGEHAGRRLATASGRPSTHP